jgi:hypothetical protein
LIKGGGARASFGFVKERLWSLAIAIPYRQIAPTASPFEAGRLQPLVEALERLCPSLQASGKDDHGNAMAWRSRQCAGGSAAIWYEPVDTDAALKVLIYGR